MICSHIYVFDIKMKMFFSDKGETYSKMNTETRKTS